MKNQNKWNIGKYWLNTEGYWKDKKRDSNTIKKLSESKFIKIAQYDEEGVLIKIWNSAKEIAIKIFQDYEIINGGSKSQIYDILNCKIIDNKFHHNAYWFRASELKKKYGEIPANININEIRKEERLERGSVYKRILKERTHIKKYSVLHYDLNGKLINKYQSTKHAAYELKTSQKIVERICSGKTKNPIYNLKYGEKTLQPINESYPEYKLKRIVRPTKNKYIKTRTKYTIIQLDEFGNQTHIHDCVEVAANFLNVNESLVRRLCLNKKEYCVFKGKKITLKYGDKIKKQYNGK